MSKVVDKSGMNRKASFNRTRADPQSSEPSNRNSGALDSGRGHTSRSGSTSNSVRNLKNVAAPKR